MIDGFGTYFWWILAGLAIIAELITFTFYFVVLALVFIITAISAYFIDSILIQSLIAAVISILGLVAVKQYRKTKTTDNNANQLFSDVGRHVQVSQWHDGTAQIKYRGANWTALPFSSQTQLVTGNFVIKEVKGPTLFIDNLP